MKREFFYGAGIAALMAAAPAVQAQEAPSGANDGGVADIVVTAQRREESLQKVSVSVTAITGSTLEERNISRPEELIYLTPDLKITEAVGPTAKGFGIRGVGTQNFGGVSQAVPVVLDEFNIPGYLGFKTFFDVENVQVLKGPQGTLYSADSSAGLINIVTKKPELGTWAAKARVSYQQADTSLTNFGTTNVNALINIPVGPNAALRVNGYYAHRDKMFYNAVLDKNVEGMDDYGFRAKFLVEPSDNFSAEITAAYSHQNNPLNSPLLLSVAPGGYFAGLLAQYGVTPGEKNDTVFNERENFGIYDDYYVNARLAWTLGDYTLTSLTSYQNSAIKASVDADNGPLPLLFSDVGEGAPGGLPNKGETFTQELKIASPSGQRLTWLGGLFFSTANSQGAGAIRGAVAPSLIFDTPTGPFIIGGADWRYNVRLNPKTYAAYLHGTYEITDGLRALAGGRIQKQTNSFRYDAVNVPYSDADLLIVPLELPGYVTLQGFKEGFSNWGHAWKLGLEYDVRQDLMVYANVTRGYKGAGFSILAVNPGDQTYVEPEIPMNYEIGAKGFLFDRKLRFSAAAFITNYKNYQAQVFEPTTSLARILTANAGALETYGAEVEFEARPVRDLSLSGGAAYIHAKFKDFDNQPCYPGQTVAQGCVGGVTDASGNDLPNSPRWTWSLAANYTPAITDNLNLIASTNYYWRSKANFSAVADPGSVVGAYGVLGASLGVQDRDGKWTLTLFAKNLLDERFPVGIGALSTLYGPTEDFGRTTYRSPDSYRQIGASLDVSF